MKTLPFTTLICFLGFSLNLMAQNPELVIPTGHTAPVSALAISPDGKYILTGSQDGIAVLWDREGSQLTSFADLSFVKKESYFLNIAYSGEATEMGITSMAIFSDGRMVTGSKSGKLIFWKSDGTFDKELKGHGKSINSIALNPEGQYFAVGDDDGNIIYWDIQGKAIWDKKKAHTKVSALAFSPDGQKLYSGGNDRKIAVWNAENGANLITFKRVKGLGRIVDLAISPNGQHIIAANLPRIYREGKKPDRSAFILDTNGKVVRELDQHEGSPLAVTFTPQSGIPVVGTSNGEVILYKENETPKIMEVHEGEVLQLKADLSDKAANHVISSGEEGLAVRLNMEQEQIVNEYSGLIGQFKGLGIHKKGKMELLWYGPNGKGGIFDLANRYVKPIEDIKEPVINASVRSQYYGPSELQDKELQYLGVNVMDLINSRNGGLIRADSIKEHDHGYLTLLSNDASRGFAAVKFSKDASGLSGLEIAAGLALADESRRRLVCGIVWNYESGARTELKGHSKIIVSAAFSLDNKQLLTGSRDKKAILWDSLYNPKVLDGHSAGVTAVAFSPDNSIIVTAGEDQTLLIRNGLGDIQHSFPDLGFNPIQALFSADGRFLFLNDEKSIVHVFDLSIPQKLGRLFLFKSQDWAFLDDDGLFDASAGAMNKMYYSIRGKDGWERLELGQLKTRFFEPNIIAKKLELAQERIRSVDGLTDVPLFPELSARINADQLSVQLNARSGGIGPVSLFVNGKEVEKDANPDRNTSFSVDLKPIQKYLNRQENRENVIALRAYNKDGWLKSPVYRLNYVPAVWANSSIPANSGSSSGELDSDSPLMFIVSIGTSDYTGEQLDLSFADQDARAMAVALQSVSSQLFSAPQQVEVYCLNTDNKTDSLVAEKGIQWQYAEKENIKAVFSEISQKASAKDIVLVYLSGHGVTYGSAEKTSFHYLTQGVSSEDLSDKAIREKFTISDEELTTWINDIPALKQVLVIDACNSGKVVQKLISGSKNLSSGQILALDRMKDRTGMFVISGSAADKVSYESSEFGQGLLTYSLLQGMNGVAVRKTSKGDFIDVMSLFQYARDEVPELAASISGIQTPMLGFPNEGASFDIGIYNEEVDIPLATQKPVFIHSNFQNEEKFADDLRLAALIDKKLQEEANKGADADLVFMDLISRDDSYSIKGRYTVKDGLITINARLFSPDGSSEPLEIAPGNDAERLSKIIYRAAKKAIRNQ